MKGNKPLSRHANVGLKRIQTLGVVTARVQYIPCGSLTTHRASEYSDIETTPSVYRPYPRRLQSLTTDLCILLSWFKPSQLTSLLVIARD